MPFFIFLIDRQDRQIDKNRTVKQSTREIPGREMQVWEHGIWTNEIKCTWYRCLEELLRQISCKPIRS